MIAGEMNIFYFITVRSSVGVLIVHFCLVGVVIFTLYKKYPYLQDVFLLTIKNKALDIS